MITASVPSQSVSLDAGDLQIGSVEIKDADTDTRAKIGAGTALVEGDNALATRDPKANTSLASILAKLTSDPATQTTLAAILAKIIAAPATEAKQDTGNTSLASIVTALTAIQGYVDQLESYTDGIEALLATAATSAKQDTQHTDLVNLLTQIVLASGTNSIGGVKDNGPQWTPVRTYTASADMSTAAAISAAPTSGQKTVLDDIIISTDTGMSFTIQEETSAAIFAKIYLAANATAQLTPRDFLKCAVADKKFFGKASVSGNVAITLNQHSEA